MNRLTLFIAGLPLLLTASCALAEPSLKDAVSVEKVIVDVSAVKVPLNVNSPEYRDSSAAKQALYLDVMNDILAREVSEFERDPVEWNDFIRTLAPNSRGWSINGRLTPERSAYVAFEFTQELTTLQANEVALCVVTFDPSAMPDDLELRHYRLLYAVLVEGDCSKEALDVSDEDLRSDLTRSIEHERYTLKSEREFDNSVSVAVLTRIYERGRDTEVLGMIAAHLDFAKPMQGEFISNRRAADRGFFVLPSGEVVAIQTEDDAGMSKAVCVIRGAPWPEVLEGHGLGVWPPRDGTPDYRRFCLEQLKEADEAYSEWLKKSFESDPIEIQIVN